tara:strand:+ start:231 stop:440 length:210 start_codon:yes stop_codon:yes gene_type:complete
MGERHPNIKCYHPPKFKLMLRTTEVKIITDKTKVNPYGLHYLYDDIVVWHESESARSKKISEERLKIVL